jgi:Tol biopolymer transport system component
VFDKADSLPAGEYTHDFEDGTSGVVEPHEPNGAKEWTVVERDDDRVLLPNQADENSDADIRIAPGENFSVQFEARRLENSEGYSWFAFDFNTYADTTGIADDMSKWISSDAPSSFAFGNRNDGIDHSSYSFLASWDTWHTYKITVQDGTEYQFFVDGELVGERTVPYGFIQGLKIEGNPDTGLWHFDDLEVKWNTEIEPATVDFTERTLLTGREGNIVAMRPDGTGHYQLTSSAHWDWMPHWIDDGNKVVFVRSTDPDGEGGQDPSHDICRLDLADMSEQALLDSNGQETYIDVSADHSKIVFHSTRDNLKDGDDGNDHLGDVYVMNADGSDVQNLTDTRDFDDLAPSFSPDGSEIAFVSGETHPNLAWRVFVMDADGNNRRTLTPTTSPWASGDFEASEPAWSPDGSTIVFETVPYQDENHVGTIYTVSSSADGDDGMTGDDPVLRYDGATEGAGSPTFNPDGSAIYFDRDGAIWTMKPNGSDAGELVPRPSDWGWYANYDFLQ